MTKANQTRQHIIEEAAPIFNKNGYAGTTMSQLTKAIQMTKGAIYGNFKDKDAIALAAFGHNFSMVSKKVSAAMKTKKNACDKLIAMANFYLDYFPVLSENGGCPILNAAVDSDDMHPELKEKVCESLDLWLGAITKILYTGIKREQVDQKTSPEQFASVFVSLIEGGLMLAKVTGNTIHLSRNVDHIIHRVNTELRI